MYTIYMNLLRIVISLLGVVVLHFGVGHISFDLLVSSTIIVWPIYTKHNCANSVNALM